MLRDHDFGIVRVRAFGTYDFKVVDPKIFLKEVAGSDHNFRLDEFSDTMRSRIVSIFTTHDREREDSCAGRGVALHELGEPRHAINPPS
jgi:membrane protease subunit (stomatin/prohibitin family)